MSKGIIAAVISAILMGISIVLSTVILDEMSMFAYLFYVYILATFFLFITLIVTREKFQIKSLLHNFKSEFSQIVLTRVIIGQILIMYGFSLTLGIRAVFITRLEPLFVFILGALLFKEVITKKKIGLMSLLLIGSLLISVGGSLGVLTEATMGDLFVAVSLILMGYSFFPTKIIEQKINAITLTLTTSIIGAIFFTFVSFLFFPISDLSVSLHIFYLMIISVLTFYAFGALLFYYSLKTVNPWIVASLLALTPIAGAIFAFLWLGQTLSSIQLIGGAIIIIATWLIGKQ